MIFTMIDVAGNAACRYRRSGEGNWSDVIHAWMLLLNGPENQQKPAWFDNPRVQNQPGFLVAGHPVPAQPG